MEQPVKSTPVPTAPPDEPYSLRREIDRAWAWVVFVWQMLRRLGGPRATLRTLAFIVALLVRRTLVQWGWSKK
ncbi:hypothetical protein GKIL_2250 [Gloeobacter kilaueensis JS1]|uniref:Uncharacterized protein n=2 Tax=Gloeobacter TaxID=33071 RepID=U5QHU7_GLOK1|nr:hypothetical protein GKIL_2250 [Gloeobacter kilaueensis JS1]